MATKIARTTRALTAELIVSSELQTAWDDLTTAQIKIEELNEQIELGEARAKTAALDYTQKLRDAASDGEDLGKIKAPAPFDAVSIHAQREVWIERVNEASAALAQGFPKVAGTEVTRLLTEVAQAEQDVTDSLQAVRDAYIKLDSISNRLSFNRNVQQWPGEIPLGSVQPSTGAIDKHLHDITNAAHSWVARDLGVQLSLLDQESRLHSTSKERKLEIMDRIVDLERERRAASSR
ncbi:hypothetical protein ACTU6V_12455 [Microbacterium sp. A204]|uniref:hypothetical protein n=1 Tax=Microbacterium sp. A204 TaxID=3457321 RepID=UPI003FD2A0EC